MSELSPHLYASLLLLVVAQKLVRLVSATAKQRDLTRRAIIQQQDRKGWPTWGFYAAKCPS